jgi:4-amino-4-deoxy-L-arabinose transferase-like glycosyltransferase
VKRRAHATPRTTRHAAGARRYLLPAVACLLAFAFYGAGVPDNPPGFYIDESSIAYNARTIAAGGVDEYGEAWPLYFRAFGDYKNPTFVYLLAAVFRFAGPSILAARLLSATLGGLAALLLGLLAARLTRRAQVGSVVAFSALLTPWLYESSRLAFEVAAYPLVVVLFLLALRRASTEERWSAGQVAALATTLALLTYTYSTGRLLGPLLAAGLALFATRRNRARVWQTWGVYALTLVPLLVFSLHNPGALGNRFRLLTYVTPQSSFAQDAREFALHYLADVNPWRWLVTGEQNIRDHVPGAPALTAATVALAAGGLFVIWRRHGREAWWRFVLYALAASVVPAALTVNDFPQLRLIAFPVLLHVLLGPALAWLLEAGGARRRLVLYAAVALILLQGAQFQWLFHARAPERWYVFDARFDRKILAPALAASRGQPVYLYDPPGHSGYIQALWHGTLRGVDASRFVRLAPGDAPPPAGALVISTEEECGGCRLLARGINYILYAVPPTDLKVEGAALPPEALRASVTCTDLPAALVAGRRQSLNVIVRNVGGATWPAVGDAEGRYAVRLRARWRKPDGSPVGDKDAAVDGDAVDGEGAARIPYDLEPGDTAGLSLRVVAPAAPGDYILELDMVQEGVAWFGARGARTLKANVKVSPPN